MLGRIERVDAPHKRPSIAPIMRVTFASSLLAGQISYTRTSPRPGCRDRRRACPDCGRSTELRPCNHDREEKRPVSSVVKKRKKKMRKHKHRKMLKKTRWQRKHKG